MTITAPDGAYTIGGGDLNYGQTVSESIVKSTFMFPTPTLDNMQDILRMLLERLPLDALKSFQPFLGLADEFFSNIGDAVNAIIDSLGIRPILQTVEMFAEWVSEFFHKLSGVFTGDIDVFVDWFQQSILSVFGWIPLSHIFPKPINLLKFGAFNAELDVSPTEGWEWDSTVTASGTSSGSAKAVCDGSTRALMRQQTIYVEPGTKLNLSARVKSSGLTGANAKIVLSVVEFHEDFMGDIVTVAYRGPSTNWATLTGEYTVPERITSVIVRLAVTEATGGSVWFDDLDLHRSGLLQMNWIEGLQSALDAASDWFQNFIDGLFEALYGIPIIGGAIEAIFTGIGDLVNTAEQAFAWAGDALGDVADLAFGLLNNAADFLGTIPQALVDGLTGILGSIGTQASNAWNNVTGLAANLLAAPAAVVGSILNVVVDGVATMGQFLINLWQGLTGGTSTAARTVSEVKTGAGSLLVAANTAQSTANTANGNASAAQTSANNAQATANNAEAQAASNAAELTRLLAAEAATATSGTSSYDNFDYTTASGMSADWSVGAATSGGGVRVDGTKLLWVDSGGNTSSQIMRYLKAKTLTSYQVISTVIDSPKVESPLGGAEAYNYLVGRLNSSYTSFVYARIGYNAISVWKVIAGVGEYQIGNAVAYTPQVGDSIQFLVGNPDTSQLRQFRVKVNNSTVLTTTDGTGGAYGPQLSVEDSVNNTWTGLAFAAGNRFGGGQTTPSALSIFSIADSKAQPMLGSILRASRNTGTNASISANDNIFPLGWFSNVDNTSDLTYDSQTGKVTVSVEGTYEVVINQFGNAAVAGGSGGHIRPILWKGAGAGSRAVEQRGPGSVWTPSTGFNGFGGTFLVYLKPGEWIEPGYSSVAPAVGGNGSSGTTGLMSGGPLDTWFSVALVNRSYN